MGDGVDTQTGALSGFIEKCRDGTLEALLEEDAANDVSGPVRLNLGAGALDLEGYTSIDRKNGTEVYPLDGYDDASVDDIYASHVLEHFSHQDLRKVLEHWVGKLKPGGRMRLAVPDLAWIAKNYDAGKPINTVGYLMGGQTDEDDFHKAIFDHDFLTELMIGAGLERIGPFEPEYADCTRLPVSLNLQGFKPVGAPGEVDTAGVVAILSAPRFGPVMHFRHVGIALGSLRIPYEVGQGAYWHIVLSQQMEAVLERGAEYVLTVDYDSVFSADEIKELVRLMRACPEADAVCGMQMKRGCEFALMGLEGKDGKPRTEGHSLEFDRYLKRVTTGHFGLTLFRAASLRALPHPWLCGVPNKDGRWEDGAMHPDIGFWHGWKKAGLKLFVAPRVPVGHIEEVIKWPTATLEPFYQDAFDYHEHGIPKEVAR